MSTEKNSEPKLELQSLDRSDMTLSFRKRIKDDKRTLELPTKAIPAGKLYHDNQILEDARDANEFYKQVDSTSLLKIRDDDPLQIGGLNKQLRRSRDDDFDFTFLEYTDAHQISKIEAFQIVGVLDKCSDYLTVPVQSIIHNEINEDAGINDPWYQKLKTGIELYLQACHESDSIKPIMGGIPPLNLPHLEDLINLYEQYDVFAFYFDFDWNLPTRRDKVARVSYFMRRIANQRLHDDILLYALNCRAGTFDSSVGYRPAANFATTMMGFDIIGENHTGPNLPPDRVESLERRSEFRMFKRDIAGFIDTPVDRVSKHISATTGIDINNLTRRAASPTAKTRFEKIYNSEQMALELSDWRLALEKGKSKEYIKSLGRAHRAENVGETIKEAFEEGLQAQIGDWT